MTALLPAFQASRFLHRLVLIGATLLPASCSAQTLSCSDPQVRAKVKDIVLQVLQANYSLAALYDLNATRFDLRAIRTVDSDDRRSNCRTDLGIEFELNGELKAGMAKPSGNPTEAEMMKRMFGNTSRSVDLRYSVERTDDGKDLYVSIEKF